MISRPREWKKKRNTRIRPRARRRFAVGDPLRKMAPRTPTGDHVGDDEDAPLLSRTSARPNAAVWMSVSMVVAGALVLAMGAAPSVLTTGMALVNGATYHPESAAAEAAVLEAEVIQPDGGMLRRENERDQRRDVEAAIEVLDETERMPSNPRTAPSSTRRERRKRRRRGGAWRTNRNALFGRGTPRRNTRSQCRREDHTRVAEFRGKDAEFANDGDARECYVTPFHAHYS